MQNYRVVFPAQNEVTIEPYELPALQPTEMLVKTDISQISIGTELTYLEANVEPDSPWWKFIKWPKVPGYNAVGVVEAIGSGVPASMLGVRLKHSGTHQTRHIIDYQKNDTYCIVPENVSSEESVFGTFGVITMGSIRLAEIRPGSTVAVFGAGLIGQVLARQAKVAGALKVFVTDVSDFRLGKLPEDPTFVGINSAKADAVQTIRDMTGGRGVDVAFECTSVPSLVDQEIRCIAKRGKLIITSSPKGKSLVDLDYCSRMGITIIGAHNFRVHPPVEIPENRWTRRKDSDHFLEMLRQKRISVSEMHTHRFHYTDAVAAYEMLMKDRSQALSVLLTWED